MFTDVIALLCPFINFLVGPWAWMVGVFAFGMGGIAILSEESKLAKVMMPIFMGLGLVMAGPKFMDVAFSKNIAAGMCMGAGANGVQR